MLCTELTSNGQPFDKPKHRDRNILLHTSLIVLAEKINMSIKILFLRPILRYLKSARNEISSFKIYFNCRHFGDHESIPRLRNVNRLLPEIKFDLKPVHKIENSLTQSDKSIFGQPSDPTFFPPQSTHPTRYGCLIFWETSISWQKL